jgi:type 1 glutamine amidotransferase
MLVGTMLRLTVWLAAAAALAGAAEPRAALFHPNTRRVLIFSGFNNHDWRTTTPFMRGALERTKRFDVRVEEDPSGISAATLAAYDAVLLDYNGQRLGATAEEALAAFVRSGKGLIVVHGASWAFNGLDVLGDNHKKMGIFEPAWTEYRKMIGGIWSTDEPATGHGDRHAFTVKVTNREHPVTRAMQETLAADDELYHYMRMQPGARVLAVAFDAPETRGTGKEEPIFWVVDYGRGRVFHTTLGHDVHAMEMDAFLKPLLAGALWAAGAE